MTVIASNPIALASSITGVHSINNQDQVVAVTAAGSGIWQNGSFTLLPIFPGDVSQNAFVINDLGVVAGTSSGSDSGSNHSVLWENNVIQTVTALTPINARAFAVNDEGVVVGSSSISSEIDQAFEEINGVATALPNLPGGNAGSSTLINSRALAVNDSNQIVGLGLYNSSIYHAILWQNGIATDLGSLSTTGKSEAVAINNSGAVVGFSVDSRGVDEAFSWQNGKMTALPSLMAGGDTLAYGIDDSGIIVGSSNININGVWQEHAVIWQNGKVIDLNSYVTAGSGWVLNEADAISVNGEVTGMGTLNGVATAYMLAVGDSQSPSVTSAAAIAAFNATPHGSAFNVSDSAANVSTNLDWLQKLAVAGKLLQVRLTDSSTPTLTLSESTWKNDALALSDIRGGYVLNLTGVSFADAAAILSPGGTGPRVSISDSSANFVAGLTFTGSQILNSEVFFGQLSSISFTDANPVLHLTNSQYIGSHGVLAAVQGNYTIDISGVPMADVFALYAGQSSNSLNTVFSHVGEIDIDDSATVVLQTKSALQELGVKYTVNITDTAAYTDPYIHQLAGLGLSPSQLFITLTDSGVPTLHTTAAQLATDAGVYQSISGNFLLAIDATQQSNQAITGVAGHANVAIFADAAADYSVTMGDGGILTVTDTGTGRNSTDKLVGVTALQFKDGTVLEAQAPSNNMVTTGNVAELYAAVLGRTPDAAGLAYYQQQYSGKSGGAMLQLAENFLNSPEYTSNAAHLYAQTAAGDAQFVTDVYESLLHRAPESGAVPYYQNVIATMTNGLTPGTSAYTNAELQGHAQVLVYFSASPEFLDDVQITAQHPADAQHWLIVT